MPTLHRFASPRELRFTLEYEEVEDNRLDLCPFYDPCLIHAGSLKWTSFTCRFCRIFLEEKERRVIEKILENS